MVRVFPILFSLFLRISVGVLNLKKSPGCSIHYMVLRVVIGADRGLNTMRPKGEKIIPKEKKQFPVLCSVIKVLDISV